jgi:hypothetical protein
MNKTKNINGPCECELNPGGCDEDMSGFCRADEQMRILRNQLKKGEENVKNDKSLLEKIYAEKNLGDGRFGLSDDNVSTKLLDKNYSPMIIRKYTRIGFPLYVSMICDYNLDNLDDLVHDCIDFCRDKNILDNSIQSARNFTGVLSDYIISYYDNLKRGCVESIAVIFYCDKMIISSLQGDAMNHNSCRQELYFLLNFMTQV